MQAPAAGCERSLLLDCRARNWIDKNLTFDKRAKISLFETVIRIIGGLLSAYDLSGDKLFLDKSQELADKLMPSLNTTRTGELIDPPALMM